MLLDIRRGGERHHSRGAGVESYHAFSFGDDYDPDNVRFGAIIAFNEEILSPGAGFAEHGHRDVELLTWVLDGFLEHHDDAGNTGVLGPGWAQCASTGGGIRHSERNATRAPAGRSTRFVQIWLDTLGSRAPRRYQAVDVNPLLVGCGLVTLGASRGLGGEPAPPLVFECDGVVLRVARLTAGTSVTLPTAPLLYVFVARGEVELAGTWQLTSGDAARITDAEPVVVVALRTAEIVVCQLADGAGSRG